MQPYCTTVFAFEWLETGPSIQSQHTVLLLLVRLLLVRHLLIRLLLPDSRYYNSSTCVPLQYIADK